MKEPLTVTKRRDTLTKRHRRTVKGSKVKAMARDEVWRLESRAFFYSKSFNKLGTL
jgi:hypothetical protein